MRLNIELVWFSFITFGCVLTTLVFCFWFVYLLDAIKSKWKFYRNALRCLPQENFDSQQQIIVYNAKTEFVKNVFLFFINLTEWLGLIFYCALCIIDITHEKKKQFYVSYLLISFTNNCPMFSLILLGNLYMYLASRYSQYYWISTYKAPFFINLFILYQVVIQVLLTLSIYFPFVIITECLTLILFTVTALFAIKQYRKLLMVISWTIVDMRVSGNILLTKKQVKMKRTFTRLSSFIWIGIIVEIAHLYMKFLLLILSVPIREYRPPDVAVLNGLSTVNKCVGLFGAILIYIQYIGYGLSTMTVVLWRLYTGKSAYRTHFHNDTPSD